MFGWVIHVEDYSQ